MIPESTDNLSPTAAARGRHALRRQGLFLLAYNLVVLFWILLHPARQVVIAEAEYVALTLAPLIGAWWCFVTPKAARVRGRSPLFLGVGLLSWAIGFGIQTYYEIVHHTEQPFPSVADIAYLSYYPLVLWAFQKLPLRPLPAALRGRVFLDSSIVLLSVVVFSWYYVLGPTMLQASDTLLSKMTSIAYPVGDLLLSVCLLMLSAHVVTRRQQGILRTLFCGVLVSVVADVVYSYLTLRGTYQTGIVSDVGWSLGTMLIGWAARALHYDPASTSDRQAAPEKTPDQALPVWRSLLPYGFLLLVGVLLVCSHRAQHDRRIEAGVDLGCLLLLGLVLLRQFLALQENRILNARLTEAYQAVAAHAERLEALATTDPLTVLPNHRAMVAMLEADIERARRYDRPCAILFLDIDHFKALNDGFGHQAGDAALAEFASVIRGRLRGTDTLGRWGGEEFVALLPETDLPGAAEAAEQIRRAVSDHIYSAIGARLTCSIGVAACPNTGYDWQSLVNSADQAMYAAKRLGRNQVRRADDPAVAAMLTESTGNTSREEEALLGTVEALITLVAARDLSLGVGADATGDLATRLALALYLDATQARMIGLAARLHDIGKVATPDAILCKPSGLTAEEWTLLHAHPAVGADVVGHVPSLRVLAPMIRGHHERWDGGGYPDGLAGTAIPFGARIIAVAEAYCAMTSDRPYRKALSPAAALQELRRTSGHQFDPDVVQAFLQALSPSPTNPPQRRTPRALPLSPGLNTA